MPQNGAGIDEPPGPDTVAAMSPTDDAEFHRLVQRRTDLLELLVGICDRATHFVADLEAFASRARNRAAVEKMRLEVAGVRDACGQLLAQLQRQPAAPPPDVDPAGPPGPPRERRRPDYLRVVGEEGGEASTEP
jgi:hypothetical protein